MKTQIALRYLIPFLFLLNGTLTFAADLNQEHDRIWVYYKQDRAPQTQNALKNRSAKIHHHFTDVKAYAATLSKVEIEELRKNPDIVHIEPDYKRYPLAQTIPYGITKVQASDVWDQDNDGNIDVDAPTGAGRLVCVIDSGLQTDHEDFVGVDVIGGHPTNWNSDTCGHGTHVAGTIAAAHNNTGVVGVTAGGTSLYIVKVFDGASCGWTYSSDLVNAAQQCEAAGANVISMSLGGPFQSIAEKNAFEALYNNDILSVAAAGNDGNTLKSYPASYDSVISVAASDENNQIASFSQKNNQVELTAPGVNILSTVPWKSINTITVNDITYNGIKVEYSADGVFTAPVIDGGLCNAIDNWSGKIVMCERGGNTLFNKVINVQNGGGLAAIIYNNVPGNLYGTLGEGNSSLIPAITITQEDGLTILANAIGNNAEIISTFEQPASGYESWQGTSMATPHVSGVAALVWSSNPQLSNNDIRQIMNTTAIDLASPGKDNASGNGLVQAYDAWLLAAGGGIPVNQPPVADFTFNCTGLTCDFDGSASSDSDGSVVSYQWDFGGRIVKTGINVSHTYLSAGDYTVNLVVTDDKGATHSVSKTVSVNDGGPVNQPPVANFSYNCSDLVCSFDGSASFDPDGSITSYQWDFGDNNSATGNVTSHTFTSAGNYTVTLTVTDTQGETGATSQTITVNDTDPVNQPPVADFTFNCTGLTCDFDGSASSDSDGSVVSYQWDFGGRIVKTGINVSHTYLSAGDYTVNLVVTDDKGATHSVSKTVSVNDGGPVNQPPVANFSYNCSDLVCSFDGSASFDPDGSITSYQWDFGDNNSATGNVTSHTFTSAGNYTVTLTVIDDQSENGTQSQSVTVTDGGTEPTGPVISNVTSAKSFGSSFSISWETDIASTSEVLLTCCGKQTNTALVTNHTMTFRGISGFLYEYFVTSKDAQGNTTTEGPFYHQN